MRQATREHKHKVVLEPATQAQENRAGLSFAQEHLQRFRGRATAPLPPEKEKVQDRGAGSMCKCLLLKHEA